MSVPEAALDRPEILRKVTELFEHVQTMIESNNGL
jgi:glycine cleavage system regulatory protein